MGDRSCLNLDKFRGIAPNFGLKAEPGVDSRAQNGFIFKKPLRTPHNPPVQRLARTRTGRAPTVARWACSMNSAAGGVTARVRSLSAGCSPPNRQDSLPDITPGQLAGADFER
jgi:hypothetical protein